MYLVIEYKASKAPMGGVLFILYNPAPRVANSIIIDENLSRMSDIHDLHIQ